MQTLLVHELPRGKRHHHVIEAFDGLELLDSLQIVVDHDPMGLRTQFQRFREGQFSWELIKKSNGLYHYSIQKIDYAPANQRPIMEEELHCGCGHH